MIERVRQLARRVADRATARRWSERSRIVERIGYAARAIGEQLASALPESLGTPTWRRPMGEYTTEVTTDLIWTWPDASKADRWVIAGFVLSFCKVGEVGGLVSECRSSVRSNERALSAKAGEELLELRVPLV